MDASFFKSSLDGIIFGALASFATLVLVAMIARVNLKNIQTPK
ncbi:MAG: hypothetical protein ACOY4Q_02575 [Bacillota bacterium]